MAMAKVRIGPFSVVRAQRTKVRKVRYSVIEPILEKVCFRG